MTARVLLVLNKLRNFWFTAVAIGFFFVAATAETPESLKGVALIVGEARYDHLTPLENPVNDAREIKRLLDALGFEARDVINRDAEKLKRDLERFLDDAEGADVALVYYSGHGIEAGGENWLIPVDADISSLAKAEQRLIPVARFFQALRERVPLTIVLLDACRSNPFPSGSVLKLSSSTDPLTIGSGGLTAKGAIALDATYQRSAGAVIGFAADPGHVALDGPKGGNSPYAAALIKHLAANGFAFGDVMTMVTQEVYVETNGRQRPWTNQSLGQFLYFGMRAQLNDGDEELIQSERRQLLLMIATTPSDMRSSVEGLAKRNGLPLDALYGMLRMLDVKATRDAEGLGERLQAGSEKLKAFLAERGVLNSSDAEITKLSALANRAVSEGAIKTSIRFHDQIKARISTLSDTVDQAKRDVKARELEFAQAFADSARTSILAFDYLTAAEDYQAARQKAETWDPRLAFTYRLAAADALTNLGDFKGDNGALRRAIENYRTALAVVSREANPNDWAKTQNNLGYALLLLGEREGTLDALKEAAKAFEAALDERARESEPLDWAMTQRNLGIALSVIGGREAGSKTLQHAVRSYRLALEEATRERAPGEWSRIQSNLGLALLALGSREGGTTNLNLKQAVEAFQAALEERPRDLVPIQWASTQLNLGNALKEIGLRENETETIKQAVSAYQLALEEIQRSRTPRLWATAQSNIGGALLLIGERENKNETIYRAMYAFQQAQEEWTRERAPLDWATTQGGVDDAFRILAGLNWQHAVWSYNRAVEAYERALEERPREQVPLKWAATKRALGIALANLGERERGTEKLERAAEAFLSTLQEDGRERVPLRWAATQDMLGGVFLLMGKRTRSPEKIQQGKQFVVAARDGFRSAGYQHRNTYFKHRLAMFDEALRRLACLLGKATGNDCSFAQSDSELE